MSLSADGHSREKIKPVNLKTGSMKLCKLKCKEKKRPEEKSMEHPITVYNLIYMYLESQTEKRGRMEQEKNVKTYGWKYSKSSKRKALTTNQRNSVKPRKDKRKKHPHFRHMKEKALKPKDKGKILNATRDKKIHWKGNKDMNYSWILIRNNSKQDFKGENKTHPCRSIVL